MKYEIYSKQHELLWIVNTKEDAERLTQGTHYYVELTKSQNGEDIV